MDYIKRLNFIFNIYKNNNTFIINYFNGNWFNLRDIIKGYGFYLNFTNYIFFSDKDIRSFFLKVLTLINVKMFY